MSSRRLVGLPVVTAALLALLGAASLPTDASAFPVTGRGITFWACWPRSHLSLEASAELIVMADEPTDVVVDGAFSVPQQSVAPGFPVVIPIPGILRNATNRTILPLGFRVRSLDATRPISVLLRVPRQAEASDDIARLLPVGEIGIDYIVSSWQASLPGEPSLYAVVATENNTTVFAEVPCTGGSDVVNLDAGEVYQVACRWLDSPPDVSGARVQSSRPVVVIAGNSDAYVPTNYLSGDFVVEAAVPVASWGREFVAVPFERGPAAEIGAYDVVRIMASRNGSVNWDDGAGVQVLPLAGAGAFVDMQLTGPVRISSNAPIAVHQFMTGVEMSDMADPSMVQLQPVADWSSAHRFYVPPDYSLGSFVTIAAPTADIATVLVDGLPVVTWAPVPGGLESWATVPLFLQAGEHVVGSDTVTSAIVHGYNDEYRPQPGLGRVPGSFAYPAADAPPPCVIDPRVLAPGSACVGRSISFADDGTSGIGCTSFLYRWLVDGAPLAGCDTWTTDPACTTTFAGEATYTLEVACAANPGCVATLPLLVRDQPAPPQVLIPDPAFVCPGEPVLIDAEIGFVAYLWTSVPPDPGVTPSAGSLNTLRATPDVDTIYSLVAVDARGCTSVASIAVTVLPDLLPPPVDDSLRVVRDGADGVKITWTDLATADVAGYEAVFLECPARDYRFSCSGRLPDPATIQAAPLVGPARGIGVQEQIQADALLRGDLIFYKVRGLSPCTRGAGPTCNGWPFQLPPCP